MQHDAGLNSVEVSIKDLAICLILIVGALVALDLVGLAFTAATGHDYVRGLIPLTDLDVEQAPGTVFSLGLMLLNGVLFVAAAKSTTDIGASRRWWFLAVTFFFLALDEQAAIHERLTVPMRDLLPEVGLLHFGWVVPYAAVVLLLSVWVGPFILGQRPEIRKWFVAAAGTFLSGALGLEVLGGWRRSIVGLETFDPVFGILSTVEEALELLGLIFLTVGLLQLLKGERSDRCLRLTD